jgi:hypothetical protein
VLALREREGRRGARAQEAETSGGSRSGQERAEREVGGPAQENEKKEGFCEKGQGGGGGVGCKNARVAVGGNPRVPASRPDGVCWAADWAWVWPGRLGGLLPLLKKNGFLLFIFPVYFKTILKQIFKSRKIRKKYILV